MTMLRTPTERNKATGSDGLARVMQLGVVDEATITDEVLAAVWDPFDSPDSRLALAKAGSELEPSGFAEIAAALPSLASPVRVIYGEQDRLLPDVADTFRRLKRDLPSANVTSVPEAGHFLPEEQPEPVGQLLATFCAERAPRPGMADVPGPMSYEARCNRAD
ncbi:MAG: hypothetical protein GEU79_17710 [Acidimicrobiia bacterium]|nr:hypothetical protein [Acidimicrobiia bacterium]